MIPVIGLNGQPGAFVQAARSLTRRDEVGMKRHKLRQPPACEKS